MGNTNGCFDSSASCINISGYGEIIHKPCSDANLHPEVRYTDSSAAWVLTAAIIVFFMKAGFMLLEVSFARSPEERRYVVVLKYQDAFASAFGFLLMGFDAISDYLGRDYRFFGVTDPNLWFFKFTFASNAATIIGGCLVTNKYKLRIPAAFVSAFVISGIIHPVIARVIWSDRCDTLSPYRFCDFRKRTFDNYEHNCSWNCDTGRDFGDRMYVLDFAGGGAVHLIGGMAGLVICLFAKLNNWRYSGNENQEIHSGTSSPGAELPEPKKSMGFWDWMYPSDGGEETVSDAALGVLILWFSWFAFNCGSTESIEIGYQIAEGKDNPKEHPFPFYGIPAVIAINMIMAGAAGGTVAIIIAVWAQVRYRTASVNANHIANGLLSALVSITAGCAFVDYWGAVLIGAFSIVVYHIGCYLEYLLKIEDTARVVPVHGLCGLWSLIATGLFMFGKTSLCNLHAAFEGLCYCHLRLPQMNYIEQLGAQIIGALIMIGVGLVGSFITYFTLYIIPIGPFVWFFDKIFFLSPKGVNGRKQNRLIYKGGWLLTHPDEDFTRMAMNDDDDSEEEDDDKRSETQLLQDSESYNMKYGANEGLNRPLTPMTYESTGTTRGTLSARSGTRSGVMMSSGPTMSSNPREVTSRARGPQGVEYAYSRSGSTLEENSV